MYDAFSSNTTLRPLLTILDTLARGLVRSAMRKFNFWYAPRESWNCTRRTPTSSTLWPEAARYWIFLDDGVMGILGQREIGNTCAAAPESTVMGMVFGA